MIWQGRQSEGITKVCRGWGVVIGQLGGVIVRRDEGGEGDGEKYSSMMDMSGFGESIFACSTCDTES